MTGTVDQRTPRSGPHTARASLLLGLKADAAEAAARPLIALAEAERDTRGKAVDTPADLLRLAHAYLMLGRPEGAVRVARRLIALDPREGTAPAILFSHGTAAEREQAAMHLAGTATDPALRGAALRALRALGHTAFSHLEWSAGRLQGFATWPAGATATLVFLTPEGQESWALDPQDDHPFATPFGRAATVDLSLPPADAHVFVRVGHQQFGLLRQTAPEPIPTRRVSAPQDGRGDRLTILIPVHDDAAATQRCIESVLAHRPTHDTRIVLVADDPPDAGLRAYLAELSAPHLEILDNPLNLGFVRSVNRGIAAIPHGDILLLNADTVLPARFAERLRAAAYGADDIGTVVPLSNNGEFVSLPVPFRTNPLPDPKELARIDASAERANGGLVIDLPSGIGFCLYITRRCLDDVGHLSGGWGRGYLEDADFCLRARAFGWRNVCAADLYVGHEGTRSFKGEKRGLVVRNLKRLGAAFPTYEAACGSFVAADPLRSVRAAIEADLPPDPRPVRLLVHGPNLADAADALLRARAEAEGGPVLRAELKGRPGAWHLWLSASDSGFPQNLRFDLMRPEGMSALTADLARRPLARIEVLGQEALPDALWQSLCGLGVAIEVRIHALRVRPGTTARFWPAFAEPAITAVLPAHEQIATAVRGQRLVLPWKVKDAAGPFRTIARATVPLSDAPVGLLLPHPEARAHGLVRALALALAAAGAGNAMFVFGSSLDDRALGSLSDLVVLGRVPAHEAADLMAALEIGRIVIADREGLGHPLAMAAGRSDLPCAFFGVGTGAVGDLVLAPDMANSEAVQYILDWIRSLPPR
ncbi:glycosyltransferase family 2 protein [Roseixanthobacter glucoisosaccharinicivorans]|uniref:glycosyltransferase family 2 protein n=1 Tax=Roseixanthobacter glucoisosaccharinicivorans TaxID=3119923 RepID=UPI0037294325